MVEDVDVLLAVCMHPIMHKNKSTLELTYAIIIDGLCESIF